MGHGSKVILFSHLDEQPEVQGPAVLVSTERVSTISPIAEDGSSSVAVDLQQLNLHNVICQAKSGMGKTAVFVLSTLQQIEPDAGQAAALVLCHTRCWASCCTSCQLRVFQYHFITEFILTKYYFLYPLTEFLSSTTAESCFGAAIKVHIMHSLFNDFCINRLE
ncbi:hypothetical protein PVK06_004456 [Gossypium arboreum]|uniref:DEAD/DEAH-box helicase domain-containing protein n=1 Tax=Gossypium arboreum TaxID=29729 RepID=A0ABR0QS15_GOSAR|nr:hypothetical protein PVK06_004456 [Gossypium arboreum]